MTWAIGMSFGAMSSASLAEIRAVLAAPSTWYAMRYKADESADGQLHHIWNVELIVVDPVRAKIYFVDTDT